MKKNKFHKIVCAIILSIILCFGSSTNYKILAAPGIDAVIGQICLMPYSFTPIGWVKCDGSAMSTVTYQSLFAAIGNTFGGDGVSNFYLPNLQSPLTGMNYFIAVDGMFPTDDFGIESYIGQVELFPNSYSSNGWEKCEGQSMSINSNEALYSILGTNFGGNGISNFLLPDLRGTEPNENLSYFVCKAGIYPNANHYSGGLLDEMLGSVNLYFKSSYLGGNGECDGNTLTVTQNTALYSLVGLTFGGNTTAFAKPDLKGAVPSPFLSYYIQTSGIYPQGQ